MVLKRLRKEKGVTIEEMSAQTGLARSTINSYERNIRRPKDETKVLLSEYFGKSVNYIFFNGRTHKSGER